MKKYLEIKSYKIGDVEVLVRIDYTNGWISLVDRDLSVKSDEKFSTKKWFFGNRQIEFMQGWLNILEAMKFAITETTKDLKEYQDEQERIKTELMIKLSVEHN